MVPRRLEFAGVLIEPDDRDYPVISYRDHGHVRPTRFKLHNVSDFELHARPFPDPERKKPRRSGAIG